MSTGPAERALDLELLDCVLAICRLEAEAPIPDWAGRNDAGLLALTRTTEELSIVCDEAAVPASVSGSRGWRALRVAGTLEHSETGILASLALPLARTGVPIFAISTFDTDYLLVPDSAFSDARRALQEAGHRLS